MKQPHGNRKNKVFKELDPGQQIDDFLKDLRALQAYMVKRMNADDSTVGIKLNNRVCMTLAKVKLGIEQMERIWDKQNIDYHYVQAFKDLETKANF